MGFTEQADISKGFSRDGVMLKSKVLYNAMQQWPTWPA